MKFLDLLSEVPKRRGYAVSPVGVMKIGSTSSTLLIARDLSKPLVRNQQLLDLFSPDSAPHLYAVVESWAKEARRHGARLLAAGGEAVRKNPHLHAELSRRLPHWWPLTSQEEGRLAWLAVKAQRPSAEIVIDIGGGSTEIIWNQGIWLAASGAARPDFKVRWPRLPVTGRPVFVGGTALAVTWWAERQVLTFADVERLSHALDQDDNPLPSLDPLRRRILPSGLAILSDLLAVNGWETFDVSERGLTEGLWLAASLGRVGTE